MVIPMKTRVLLLAAVCATVAACHPSKPRADYGKCMGGHTESSVILSYGYNPSTNSYQSVLVPTTDFVCDKWQYPLGDGPAYHEDVKRYEREMVEWRKDHPND